MVTLMRTHEESPRLSRRRALTMAAGLAAAGAVGQVATTAARTVDGDGSGMMGAANVGIIVNGNGVAKAPAVAAILQFIVRLQDPYANDPMAAERAGAGGGYGYGNIPGPSEEQLQQIADAIEDAGIARSNVEIVAMPAGSAGMFGYGTGLVLALIDDAGMFELLPAMVEAGTQAAWDYGMTLDQVGASYMADDCETMAQQALAGAVSNARKQAEDLAVALGVELGDLIGATTYGMYSPSAGYVSGESGCAAVPDFEQAKETWLPGYTGTNAPEFEVSVQVQLTYAFDEA